MCNIPDSLDLFFAHQAKQEQGLSRCPRCCNCGEHITDDYLYDIDGDLYCEDCLDDVFKKPTEDYEE